MRRAHEEVLDVVAVLHVHPGHADAPALLLAVRRQRQGLDVAGLRDRDDHLLVGDQVLDVDLVLGGRDLRAPLVGEALGDLQELLLDDREHAAPRRRGSRAARGCARSCRRARVLIASDSSAVSWARRRSRIADAWIIVRPKRVDELPRALSRSREARIRSMIASRLSSAISRPSRMWTRASRTLSSCFVRRTTTSR